jgi:hypothetical protein
MRKGSGSAYDKWNVSVVIAVNQDIVATVKLYIKRCRNLTKV